MFRLKTQQHALSGSRTQTSQLGVQHTDHSRPSCLLHKRSTFFKNNKFQFWQTCTTESISQTWFFFTHPKLLNRKIIIGINLVFHGAEVHWVCDNVRIPWSNGIIHRVSKESLGILPVKSKILFCYTVICNDF